MNQNAIPSPSAIEGTLADRPWPLLMHQLFRKRITGRLCVADDSDDRSEIFLRDGCAVHVNRPNDLDRLDRVLLDAGLVSRAVLTRAQEAVSVGGKRLGQVLLDLGAIDPHALNDAIRSQLRRKLMRMFFVRDGVFELFLEEHTFGVGDELAQIRIDPRSLLFQGLRTGYDDARLMTELRALDHHAFRLVTLPDGFLEAMGLDGRDPFFRSLATSMLTLPDVTSFSGKPSDLRATILTLLYCDLLVTKDLGGQAPASQMGRPRMTPLPQALEDGAPLAVMDVADIEVESTGHPAVYTAGSSSRNCVPSPSGPLPVPAAAAAPKSESPVAKELAATVQSLHARLDAISFFELLGLTESATSTQINAAFMKGVRQFHPDRLAGLGLANLMSKAEAIMARMTQASQILSDNKRRMEYVRGLRGEKNEADSARSILEAESCFKNGETSLKRGDLKRAMASFTEAVQKMPKETEYRAYLAWTRYADSSSRKDVIGRDTLRIIADAVKERPHFARAHFWIGKIHQQLGANDMAEIAFKKALSVDAEFIDAERELRLLTMRTRKGTLPQPQGSTPKRRSTLMTRLLKRGE